MALKKLKEFLTVNMNNMKKDDLVKLSKEIQNNIRKSLDDLEKPTTPDVSFIFSRLETIERNQEKMVNEISTLKEENKTLKRQLKDLDKDMDEYDEWITNIETTTSQIDQYIRRENLEISGIPSSTPQHELEGKVINILFYY